jgi:hypothetical protein
MALETILASVVLPPLIDLVKGGAGALSRKFVGISVEDEIKLKNSDVDKLKALAQLDNPNGTPSQWVVDVRAIYRYAAATLVIIVGCAIAYMGVQTTNKELITSGLELIGTPFGFIFGERLWLGLKGSYSK